MIWLQVAELFSAGKAIDTKQIKIIVNWPPKKAQSLEDLKELESIHDVFDMYLWMR